MVRRLTAVLLSAALVLLSAGHDAGRAFAAVTTGRVVAPVSPVPASAAAAVLTRTSPSLTSTALVAPAGAPMPVMLAAPVLRPLDAAAPKPVHSVPPAAHDAPRVAASVSAMTEAVAAPLEAIAGDRAGASADRSNAQTVSDVITGQRSIAAAADTAVLGSPAGFRSLAAPSDAPSSSAKGAPAAPAAAPITVVDSAFRYAFIRRTLAKVAAKTGAVHSLPAAGPAIIDSVMAQAAFRSVVISDFDDTLAAYNQTLSPEMIEAIRAVKAAGKHFVVISDRGDEKRAHQLTVFESLETLPVELRAGMYVAANSGGRVYRYDAQGVPQRVYEMPALADENKAKVSAAAEATKARMGAELKAEQHFPSETNNNPSESWNTYGYAMMLKVGSNEKQVRGAAAILQEELAKQGIEAEVKPRFAKDPANPPYINFSIVTKQPATAYIAKALGATAKDVVVVGDSMYDPREARPDYAGGKLDRLAERLSGRAMPKTGNATDSNMEKALPGVLTVAVGHNADPRMSNVWVTGVKGPEATRRLLYAVASKPASPAGLAAPNDAPETGKKSAAPRQAEGQPDGAETAFAVAAVIALAAAAGLGYYFLIDSFAKILVEGEMLLRQHFMDMDGFMSLGAGLGMAGIIAGAGASAWKPVSYDLAALSAQGVNIYISGRDASVRMVFPDEASLAKASVPATIAMGNANLKAAKDFAVTAVVAQPEKPMSRGERIALSILLPLAVVASLSILYMVYSSMGTLPSGVEVPPGWHGPIPSGWEDLFGAAGLTLAGTLGLGASLRHPAETVGAEERAHHAVLGAVAGVEKVSGRRSFWISPAASYVPLDGRIIDVEFKDLASLLAARDGGLLPEKLPSTVVGIDEYSVAARLSKAGLEAEIAKTDAARREALEAMGALSVEIEAQSSEYGDYRSVAAVFADKDALDAAAAAGLLAAHERPKTGVPGLDYSYYTKGRVEGPWARRSRLFLASTWGRFAAWLGLASVTAAVYASLYWASTQAPAATPSLPQAPGGWESLFRSLGML